MNVFFGAELPCTMLIDEIVSNLYRDFSLSENIAIGEAHDFPELIYIVEGNHILSLDGKIVELNEGQMIIYAPLAFHIGVKPTNAKARIISFRTCWDDIRPLYNKVITLNNYEKELLLNVTDKCYNCLIGRAIEDVYDLSFKDGVSELEILEIKRLLELFFISVVKRQKSCIAPISNDFRKVANFLRENVFSRLTLEEIAEQNFMSVSKLKMIFRNNCNGGAINYHINLKIEKAKELLNENKYNISEISEKLGFNSQHYFSRLFKSRTGISPIDYSKASNNLFFDSQLNQ